MTLGEKVKISVEKLTEKLLRQHPVWEFCNDDDAGETVVTPVKKLPISTADSRIVGCELRLANGSLTFGFLGTLSLTKSDQNQHFLTLSIFIGGVIEHLSRYHDFDFAERGPAWLAKKLGKKVEEVFPIFYDVSAIASGSADCLRGFMSVEPKKKLSRREIIQLAVDG